MAAEAMAIQFGFDVGKWLKDHEATQLTREEGERIVDAVSDLAVHAGLFSMPGDISVFDGVLQHPDGSGRQILGCVWAGNIWLSRVVLQRGLRETIETLAEEIAHKKSGASDETRQFQDFLICRIADMVEWEKEQQEEERPTDRHGDATF